MQDATIRCTWVGANNELYQNYHDEEWGVPVYDDRHIFEHLVLETSQAGLSWLTILKKREGYRKAFAEFDPEKVAKFIDADIEKLVSNPEIIRNRQKITAAITNAQKFLEVQKEFGSFSKYQWQFVGGKPIQNSWKLSSQLPAITSESIAFSAALKKRGFSFIGPTTIYAHMQAIGMVNDHTTDCFRYKSIAAL